MKRNFWAADRIRFQIRGADPQRYVNRITARGLQLDHIRWKQNGCVAQGFGRDYSTLRRMAEQGGWEFSILRRHGPGRFLERCMARPGIPAGAILFVLLLNLLPHFVWVIDFGTLEQTDSQRMRALLAECGICEGTFLQKDTLEDAQAAALAQSDLFGWVSLNFTGGCLFIEDTVAHTQTVREDPPLRPLYAKADGVITAVEAESGFACVVPGQTVKAGQLLVDIVRLDREEREILQGASGKILARCEETFTASEPLSLTATVPGTAATVRDTLYFLGGVWPLQQEEVTEADRIEWIPLRLGRLSLPGCLQRETAWGCNALTLYYSPEQAEALARRNCRQQLLESFPDAEILAEHYQTQTLSDAVVTSVTYQFVANIAIS